MCVCDHLCVRIHTGVGHTDSESAQHFWLGRTHKFFLCSWRMQGLNLGSLDIESDALHTEPPHHRVVLWLHLNALPAKSECSRCVCAGCIQCYCGQVHRGECSSDPWDVCLRQRPRTLHYIYGRDWRYRSVYRFLLWAIFTESDCVRNGIGGERLRKRRNWHHGLVRAVMYVEINLCSQCPSILKCMFSMVLS